MGDISIDELTDISPEAANNVDHDMAGSRRMQKTREQWKAERVVRGE